jgi:hypothetical protein
MSLAKRYCSTNFTVRHTLAAMACCSGPIDQTAPSVSWQERLRREEELRLTGGIDYKASLLAVDVEGEGMGIVTTRVSVLPNAWGAFLHGLAMGWILT